MDNMAYLQQIADDSRPKAKQSKGLGDFFSWKFLGIIGGVLVLAITIIIVGSMLSNVSDKEKDAAVRLNYRLSYLNKTVDSYRKKVKSSNLRSMSVTFNSIMTDTSRDLGTVIGTSFSADSDADKESQATIAAEESAHISTLNSTLDNAILNGRLDRAYYREISLELTLLMSLESELLARTSKPELISLIQSSYESLSNLQKQFEEFSDNSV